MVTSPAATSSTGHGPAHGQRVYVDNALLSRLTDYYKSRALQLSPDDIDALDAISDEESLDLVTSEKTLHEILRLADRDHQVILKLLYRVMRKVPITRPVRPLPQLTRATLRSRSYHPGNVIDPLFLELTQLFELDDAEHLYHAVSSGCRYFLTADYHTILNRRAQHRAVLARICPDMEIVSPKELRDLL